MMKDKRVVVVGCLLMMLSLCGCSHPVYPTQISSLSQEGELSGRLSLNGSTSMSKLCDGLGEAFTDRYPNVQYEKSNTGSGAAVLSVVEGTALIGDLSRELQPSEQPERFTQVLLAMDAIAVVVSSQNPTTALSKEQLRQIFTGEITDWQDVSSGSGRITVVGRESASGTRSGFESAIGALGECRYQIELSEAGDILSRVASDPAAIGYLSLGAAQTEKVHLLAIDGVMPSEETVEKGEYPIVRPFYEIYRKGDENPLITAWFDFVASSEGEKIIQSQNFVPMLSQEDSHG